MEHHFSQQCVPRLKSVTSGARSLGPKMTYEGMLAKMKLRGGQRPAGGKLTYLLKNLKLGKH